MKKIIIIIITLLSVVSCEKYEYRYPQFQYPDYIKGIYKKDFPAKLFVDNSKLKNFQIKFIYEQVLDTNKIDDIVTKLDTIIHDINSNLINKRSFEADSKKSENIIFGIDCFHQTFVDGDYLDPRKTKSPNYFYNNFFFVYEGKNVEIQIIKNHKIIESYKVDIVKGANYIINPLSYSVFVVKIAQYGGNKSLLLGDEMNKYYNESFIKLPDDVEFWFRDFPETISVRTSDDLSYYGQISFKSNVNRI